MPRKVKKIFLFLTIIGADQFLKYLVQKNLLPDWGGVFVSVCNPFLSWGIPLQGLWFWILWLFALGGLVFLIKKFHWNIFLLAALAGAISNFIDRLFHNCVIDFIKIGSFPIFNLADICITLGIMFFILSQFRNPNQNMKRFEN